MSSLSKTMSYPLERFPVVSRALYCRFFSRVEIPPKPPLCPARFEFVEFLHVSDNLETFLRLLVWQMMLIRNRGSYTLREINVDAMIIDQDSLHLEIRLLTVLLFFKLNKSVLQTVAGALIADDFTG